VNVLAVNLWSPQHGLAVGVALLTAFLLGVVHGVAPDEHTWPITFSYAVGSFSARKGMRSALAFSLAFTLQRRCCPSSPTWACSRCKAAPPGMRPSTWWWAL
jgi:hypothetical protein